MKIQESRIFYQYLAFWILYPQFGSIPPQKTTLQKKLDINRALEYYIISDFSCSDTMSTYKCFREIAEKELGNPMNS